MSCAVRSCEQANEKTIREPWGSLNWLATKDFLGCTGLTVGRVKIAAGLNNPRHRHNTCEEILYLLSGTLRHTVGEESVVLKAGDTLRIPAGVYHNATTISNEDADMIVAYSTATRDFELEKRG